MERDASQLAIDKITVMPHSKIGEVKIFDLLVKMIFGALRDIANTRYT
jgi:hypothetical protein